MPWECAAVEDVRPSGPPWECAVEDVRPASEVPFQVPPPSGPWPRSRCPGDRDRTRRHLAGPDAASPGRTGRGPAGNSGAGPDAPARGPWQATWGRRPSRSGMRCGRDLLGAGGRPNRHQGGAPSWRPCPGDPGRPRMLRTSGTGIPRSPGVPRSRAANRRSSDYDWRARSIRFSHPLRPVEHRGRHRRRAEPSGDNGARTRQCENSSRSGRSC